MSRNERGQALVIIVFVMIGLLLVVGLAVDGGRLLTARRDAQNAADAAAMAGTRELATLIQDCEGSSTANDASILAAVNQYAAQNGFVPDNGDTLQAWYVDMDTNQLAVVGEGVIPEDAVGVQVQLSLQRQTLLIRMLGPEAMAAPGDATALCGPVIQFPGGLLPIGVPVGVVQAMDPGQDFCVRDGQFCEDPDGFSCIGDPGDESSHRGWLNYNWIYNIEYLSISSPFYRTFETSANASICGRQPDVSYDDGIRGWASGECPYVYPLFGGTVGAGDGDFIHGSSGESSSGDHAIYDSYAGQVVYVPIFDAIYDADDMGAMGFPLPEYYPGFPHSNTWPSADTGWLYHIVGFTAVRLSDEEPHGSGCSMEGEFQEAIIGAGLINPHPLTCEEAQNVVMGVTLWR